LLTLLFGFLPACSFWVRSHHSEPLPLSCQPPLKTSGSDDRQPNSAASFLWSLSARSWLLAVVCCSLEDGKRYSAGATTIWLAIETLAPNQAALPLVVGSTCYSGAECAGIVLEDGPDPGLRTWTTY